MAFRSFTEERSRADRRSGFGLGWAGGIELGDATGAGGAAGDGGAATGAGPESG